MTLLLDPGRGPDPAWLAARVAWWREREAAFAAHAPLDVEPPDLVLSAEDHAQANTWLPPGPLVDDVERALRAWFDDALAGLGGLDLRTTDLGRWRSWLDARARQPGLRAWYVLPSELLSALAGVQVAHALLFALAAPPSIGSRLCRYGLLYDQTLRARPRREVVRAWDVGCGTGEGTWELASDLRVAGDRVEVLGTTPCPLQVRMAERRARPHEPGRAAELESFVRRLPDRCAARFLRHDVLLDPPPGTFDVIGCQGLLGEGIHAEQDIDRVVRALAGALEPRGLLVVADRFRQDRHARAAALVERAALGAGLWPAEPGVFVRR